MPLDVRLIDPTREQLVATLRRAQAAANRSMYGLQLGRLERGADFWHRFARECLREREGRRRSCRGGSQTPEVIAAWWTDPAGRKHFRVIGRTRSPYHLLAPRRESELRDLPPWWQVYPESVVAVRRLNTSVRYLACCRCAALGTPGSLGWMGDTCGPCFDRRADGGTLAGGFGHFPGWAGSYAGSNSRIGFSADSTRLVGQSTGNRLRIVNRADGTEVLGKTMSSPIAGVVCTPGGYVIAHADGTVWRWASDGAVKQLVKLMSMPIHGRVLLAPDGSRCFVSTGYSGFIADLTEPRPRYRQYERFPVLMLAGFAPSSKRILGVTYSNQLIEVDPDTLTDRVLRTDLSDGSHRYRYAQDLAIAPDECSIAVVRDIEAPHGGGTRLLPIGPGPARDLPVLPWLSERAVAFAPDGEHLVTADTRSGWVGFWRLKTGWPVGFVRAVPEDPSWGGGQLLFAPDGRSLALLCTGHHSNRGSTVVVWPWPEMLQAAGSG